LESFCSRSCKSKVMEPRNKFVEKFGSRRSYFVRTYEKIESSLSKVDKIRFLITTKWQNVQTLPKNVQSTPKKVQPTPEFVHPTPKIVQTPNPPAAANPPPNKKRKAPRKVTSPKTPNPAAHL
jgi:hypothetical protein